MALSGNVQPNPVGGSDPSGPALSSKTRRVLLDSGCMSFSCGPLMNQTKGSLYWQDYFVELSWQCLRNFITSAPGRYWMETSSWVAMERLWKSTSQCSEPNVNTIAVVFQKALGCLEWWKDLLDRVLCSVFQIVAEKTWLPDWYASSLNLEQWLFLINSHLISM